MNTITNSTNVLSLYYQNRLNQTSANKTQQTQQYSKTQSSDPLEALVTSGTITEEQQQAILAALQKNALPPQPPQSMEAQGNPMEDTLSALVEDNTITEDQRSAIQDALEAMRQSGPQGAGGKEAFESVLNNLVDEGTISQEQMDAITEAMDEAMKSAPPPPPPRRRSARDLGQPFKPRQRRYDHGGPGGFHTEFPRVLQDRKRR